LYCCNVLSFLLFFFFHLFLFPSLLLLDGIGPRLPSWLSTRPLTSPGFPSTRLAHSGGRPFLTDNNTISISLSLTNQTERPLRTALSPLYSYPDCALGLSYSTPDSFVTGSEFRATPIVS
jgi:hypothetical protein